MYDTVITYEMIVMEGVIRMTGSTTKVEEENEGTSGHERANGCSGEEYGEREGGSMEKGKLTVPDGLIKLQRLRYDCTSDER